MDCNCMTHACCTNYNDNHSNETLSAFHSTSPIIYIYKYAGCGRGEGQHGTALVDIEQIGDM